VVPVVDAELLSNYDVSAPRYTSYPTAPQFTTEFGPEAYAEELVRADGEQRPLSLYFHLPFCESVCFFCGCNVTFTSDRSRPGPYTTRLAQEMDWTLARISPGRQVQQLHWGGGTPTFFKPEQLELLWAEIVRRFQLGADAEIGVEIDPRETTPEHLKVLAKCGFNRLSMGVQDFDPEVQRAVNRVQGEELTASTIAAARDLGMSSISLDLIYGLPLQTEATFARTIERVVALRPDRIALFNFAYLPEMIRHQKAIKADQLPSPSVKIAILRHAIEAFTAAGYRYVGMDHFALPGDPLCQAQDAGTLYRNFQGYTTHAGCDLLGFGVSAIGQVGRCYAQNVKNVHDYAARIDAGHAATWRGMLLSAEDELRRDVIMRLMCDFAVDLAHIGQPSGVTWESHFAKELEALVPLEADGLVRRVGSRIEVTPVGRLLVRNVCLLFDAYLATGAQRKFSRTI
jgi:oxygen-independent coproporphyrinogen-3 oxidase